MNTNEKHYCVIIGRATSEEIKDMGVIEAPDWYYARHIAADKFRKENKEKDLDWFVDSFKVE
jgi:hypothetical protein